MEESIPQENSEDSKKEINPLTTVIVVIVLIIIAGVAYSLIKPKTQTPATQTTNSKGVQPTQNVPSTSSPSGTVKDNAITTEKIIEMIGQNFTFAPVAINVKKGDKVTVNFKSVGGFHDFVIDEFNVKTETIGSGKTATVSFTADKAGTFEFYCSVGNHRAMGMKGTLTVTP